MNADDQDREAVAMSFHARSLADRVTTIVVGLPLVLGAFYLFLQARGYSMARTLVVLAIVGVLELTLAISYAAGFPIGQSQAAPPRRRRATKLLGWVALAIALAAVIAMLGR